MDKNNDKSVDELLQDLVNLSESYVKLCSLMQKLDSFLEEKKETVPASGKEKDT